MNEQHPIRPRRLLPSLMALQCFDAAVRHMSFTRAAEDLCMTQSAISRQVRLLEQFLDQPLFHRSKNRLVLTAAGSDYADTVRGLLDQAEGATLQLMAHGGAAQMLNIAVLPTFGSRWLVPRLGDFIAEHPEVHLNLQTYLAPFELEHSEIDVALHFGSQLWPGATCRRLMGEVSVPVCAPSLIGGTAMPANATALSRYPLLQLSTRPRAWMEWFSQVGAREENAFKGPRFDQFYMVIQAAVAGLGMALLPRFLIEDELATGRLVVAAEQALETSAAYWLAVPEKKAHLPQVGAFCDWLIALVGAPVHAG